MKQGGQGLEKGRGTVGWSVGLLGWLGPRPSCRSGRSKRASASSPGRTYGPPLPLLKPTYSSTQQRRADTAESKLIGALQRIHADKQQAAAAALAPEEEGDKAYSGPSKGLRGVPKQESQGWLANVGVRGFLNNLVRGGEREKAVAPAPVMEQVWGLIGGWRIGRWSFTCTHTRMVVIVVVIIFIHTRTYTTTHKKIPQGHILIKNYQNVEYHGLIMIGSNQQAFEVRDLCRAWVCNRLFVMIGVWIDARWTGVWHINLTNPPTNPTNQPPPR